MYQRLYKQIIDQAKTQNRQTGQGIYYEWHHIVQEEFMFKLRKRKGPKGHLSGDPNHPDNLVLLTFREHLMCHYYLYEIHKDGRYGYQTGSSLQFFSIKAGNDHMRQRNLSGLVSKYNQIHETQYKYDPYYQSQQQRQLAREFNHNNLAKKVHKDQTP